MVDQKAFRQALGRFATGVAVVTTMDDHGQPHGLTINSFASVSLDPPLVLWSLDKRSQQLPVFSESGFYGINILSAQQKRISDLFASFMGERFDKLVWETGETGAPLFPDALACLDCKLEKVIEGGDHVILLGRVIGIESRDGDPLLYYGGYRSLGDPVSD